MLSNKTIMAFLATTDPSRARPFYENILGLALKRTDPYAMVFDSNGIELRMTTVKDLNPVSYSVMSWIVPDIHETVAGLCSKGVIFEMYSFFEQDADGVWHSPDGTMVAWFKDPDGNLLSLTQFI
jgi:predicted enzyme related to lactoylglutathione lyase